MKNATALMLTLALAGCMTPQKFDAKYRAKFCEEWTACNPDNECELPESDTSTCTFNKEAAKSCLESQWVCDNSNTALPILQIPATCGDVYTNCTLDTGGGGTATGGTTSGTTSGSTSR